MSKNDDFNKFAAGGTAATDIIHQDLPIGGKKQVELK